MTSPNHAKQGLGRRAFTLVEMITVVGIIALLVVLATPTLVDVLRSTRMTSAGDNLINRMSLAQQEAITRSREVEVRFYRYRDPTSSFPTRDVFWAYQVVAAPVNGAQPQALSEPYFLESGLVFAPDVELSPMLRNVINQSPVGGANDYLFTPRGGAQPAEVSYTALRYYPDGGCRLLTVANASAGGTDSAQAATAFTIPNLSQSFLTLIDTQDLGSGIVPPRNYYCVQIDAYTGKARVYRP